jgi:hypothetical protein
MNAAWTSIGIVMAGLLFLGSAPALADKATLVAKHAELKPKLAASHFKRPLHLDSSETRDRVAGDAYAVVEQPFNAAAGSFTRAADWCEILMLHMNTKACRASGGAVSLSVGAKHDQPLDQAQRVDFTYKVASQTPDYVQVLLTAGEGPIGTRDYRIMLEATPIEGKTFIHLSYSYGFGAAGRMAMKMYLGTAGKDKVGFTSEGNGLVGGARGMIERNTMRYYLALEAFLASPQPAQLEKRLRDWFAAHEAFPRQLHEISQSDYLEMKRKEYQRLQTTQVANPA